LQNDMREYEGGGKSSGDGLDGLYLDDDLITDDFFFLCFLVERYYFFR